jgi:uncharacterized protein (TIGR00369 family)
VADDRRVELARRFLDSIPHNRALGLQVVDMQRAMAVFLLPYAAKLVGNPDTGVIHGGAITALIDACSGAAVFAALDKYGPIATLDLRIDYLRAPDAGQAVTCRATCYKVTRNVAFTRAVAYTDDEQDPVASSAGTFMLQTKGTGKT